MDQEFAGTPFGSGPQTFNSQAGPNNSYQDVWTTTASSGTANPITYSFHYLVFANDPTVYCYEVLNHAATDPATSVGQGQFLFRSNPSLFPNLYQVNTGPNQLGTSAAVTTIGVPSTNANWGSVSSAAGRTVQNVTYDLTGSGIPGDNGTNFFTKYDYSIYTQFFQAETMYGSQYAVTLVNPSVDTLSGGPTKQELAWTDPAILNMEFLSDHYGIDGSGSGAYPGYGYYPTQGVSTTKLYGPFGFTMSSTTAATAATITQNAINAIPNSQAEFDTDAELAASGYTATTSRGTLQVSVSSSASWSATRRTTPLCSPSRALISRNRRRAFSIGASCRRTAQRPSAASCRARIACRSTSWGSGANRRFEGVQIAANKITVPTNARFTPENFGTAAPIWTIGTPDRSAHEFLNGHNAAGADDAPVPRLLRLLGRGSRLGQSRQGRLLRHRGRRHARHQQPQRTGSRTSGAISIPANTTPPTAPRTTTPRSVRPMSPRPAGRQLTPVCPGRCISRPPPRSVPRGNTSCSPWRWPPPKRASIVTLDGHQEIWHAGSATYSDPMARSGDAGFYQWAAFQFPRPISSRPTAPTSMIHLQRQHERRRNVRCLAHGDHQHVGGSFRYRLVRLCLGDRPK